MVGGDGTSSPVAPELPAVPAAVVPLEDADVEVAVDVEVEVDVVVLEPELLEVSVSRAVLSTL
jgi:hypothetical protein